jgi:hypothetical protein
MSQVRLAMLLMLASAGAVAAPAQGPDSANQAGAAPSVAGKTQTANTKPRNFVTANSAGMVVVVDRTTGGTRALTAEEAQNLAQGIEQLVNQSTDGLVQVRRADGSVSMDLQGRFQNVMLAKKEDDGTISQACVDNDLDAAAFFEIDPDLLSAAKRAVSQAGTPLDIR